MSRIYEVPVVVDGSTVYLPGSTLVEPDRPVPRGLGRRPPKDARVPLQRLPRGVGPGPLVRLPDGRRGRIEGYYAEVARLRETVADLEAMRDTWTRAVAADMMGAQPGSPT